MSGSAGERMPLPSLPPGDGMVSVLFIWYMVRSEMEFDEFERAIRLPTKTIYGRKYVTGVDQKKVLEMIR